MVVVVLIVDIGNCDVNKLLIIVADGKIFLQYVSAFFKAVFISFFEIIVLEFASKFI